MVEGESWPCAVRSSGPLATVKRTLNRVGSPVLLVGHSYGGATITASGVDDRVAGLVYIGAVARM